MQHFYSKLVRKSYRTLRHPRIRKVSWLNRMVLKLFVRDLWRPCIRSISVGLSIGLFCSMLPIPMQMLLAAACCFIGRGNIPITVAACWVSNPITQIPLMLFQERVGASIRDFLDLGWLNFIDIQGTIPFLDKTVNLANFAVGVSTTAITLGILAYPAVFCFYALVPKKYLQTVTHNIKKSSSKNLPEPNPITVDAFTDHRAAATQLALEAAALILENNAKGKKTVLGLTAGSTPIGFYQALIHLHQTENLSFENVITFTLDEYIGLDRQHPESFWQFMHQNFFNHIDIKPENIHAPIGNLEETEIPAHCEKYEQDIKDAGGIQLQILDIGRSGTIGFNEPGSLKNSLTRAVQLNAITRQDAADNFAPVENIPTSAITMGCGTIMAAKRIVLLAWGKNKASIVNKAANGPITANITASYLQEHPNVAFYTDQEAAAEVEKQTSLPLSSTEN